MRHLLGSIVVLASMLALAGCVPSGRLTPTGTGQTPSGGLVPGQMEH